ncbi:MAG: GMC family oxidoreductase [Deltaproteobacteria bacterium]|nr:MAG: GMC family oxidoreductase [Deltaproteobacteria bacterium]
MASDDVLGSLSLTEPFDFCIIGSGAGGGTAAHVLSAAGKSVLVLEAGGNPFPGLDQSAPLPFPLHSNDELKYSVRSFIKQDPFLEPRTFRTGATDPGTLMGDVNTLPKAVGGAFQHADAKTPRFNAVDFRLKSAVEELIGRTPGLAVPGFGADAASANFADWPFSYADLEPFYVEAERLYGVQGNGDNVYESRRSQPYLMPAGVGMYFALLLADGATRVTVPGIGALNPHTYPAAINSRFSRSYDPSAPDDRPPCVDCGLCSGFGCPNNSKNSPAVTTLRRALLSGRCQLRFNAVVTRLVHSGRVVSAAEYVDGAGNLQTVTAHAFILAASAIESARLCLLSDPAGAGLGNSSGQVGQNLMFHLQNNVNGFLPQRVHGQRGRAVTHGISDFRGVKPGGEEIRVFTDGSGTPRLALGGICEFGASQGQPITEDANVYTVQLPGNLGLRSGIRLKNAIRDGAIGQHLLGLTMQAEDAPQRSNAVDLDRRYTDVYGRPVARITYSNHAYETETRKFYLPYMKQVCAQAGVRPEKIFVTPINYSLVGPPSSRHIMGTLRMGTDPAASVVDPGGRFHDLDNLFACDGGVFPTASGYNPTLTIIAVALKIAHGIAGTAPGG